MSKKIIAFAVALVMLFSAVGVSAQAPIFTRDEDPDFEVPYAAIIFTNDVHCGIEDGWGYSQVSFYKKLFQELGAHTLLVDAGDHAQGGPIGTLSRGGYIIDIMNFVGYDLAIPGNHEFDYGIDRFFELVEHANYPYISSNFMHYENGEGTETVFDPYKIFELGDIKIGFVGICTPESITSSTPIYFQNEEGEYIYGFCQDATGDGVVEAAQAAVDAVREQGVDYVVVIGHCGIEDEAAPWRSTDIIPRLHGINAFIDGHSHTVINQVVEDADGNPVYHGQTGTKLENLGTLMIYEDGRMEMGVYPPPEIPVPDPETQEYIESIKAEYEELLNEVVAYTPQDLVINDPETGERIVRRRETNLGDLCADAYRNMLDADIAIVNGGGVRADIHQGEVTYGDILNVHPFGNEACLVEVSGQQILDALELGARACPGENGGFLQVSGLTYEIHTDMAPNVVLDEDKMWVGPAGIPYRVQNVCVMNRETGAYEPLDLEKTYTLASHNYMLKDQGDGFAMFGKDNINILMDNFMIDNAVLINYFASMEGGEVDGVTYDHVLTGYENPYGEGRIIIVEHTEPTPGEPTPEPAEPTAEPAEPTPAPAEPTPAPAEPTPAPAEPTPAPIAPVPPTGTIALTGIGFAAIISGAAVLFRRKDD